MPKFDDFRSYWRQFLLRKNAQKTRLCYAQKYFENKLCEKVWNVYEAGANLGCLTIIMVISSLIQIDRSGTLCSIVDCKQDSHVRNFWQSRNICDLFWGILEISERSLSRGENIQAVTKARDASEKKNIDHLLHVNWTHFRRNWRRGTCSLLSIDHKSRREK